MGVEGWRSLLYVPAHKEALVAGASRRGAAAIILDLEDGVPAPAKQEARERLTSSVSQASSAGADALVRVNRPWRLAWRDIEASLAAGADGIVLPKVESTSQVQVVDEFLTELEPGGANEPLPLVAIIETAKGLALVREITEASPRLCALIPGNQDLAAELGVEADEGHLFPFLLPLLIAARAAGLLTLGTMGGSADFRDLGAWRERVEFGLAHGIDGVTCIHPDQVRVVNEVYAAASDLSHAREIVQAFEAGGGEVVEVKGRMVDLPVYRRAKRQLEER